MSPRSAVSLSSLAAGLLFGVGLALSGMTRPEKVLGFLDLGGSWDPSLAFVMLGAVALHGLAYRSTRSRPRPLFAERFSLPESSRVDLRLLGGAALFGAGWGGSGYCPGPALGSLVTGNAGTLVFVASMLVGAGVVAALDAARGPDAVRRTS